MWQALNEEQEVYDHEALGGNSGQCLYCRLTSFSQSLQTFLRITLDGTQGSLRRGSVWRVTLFRRAEQNSQKGGETVQASEEMTWAWFRPHGRLVFLCGFISRPPCLWRANAGMHGYRRGCTVRNSSLVQGVLLRAWKNSLCQCIRI